VRLPSASIDTFRSLLAPQSVRVLGALSFEDRCLAVPEWVSDTCSYAGELMLLQINDPEEAFPNYRELASRKIRANAEMLERRGIPFRAEPVPLLAPEDKLLEIFTGFRASFREKVMILDITSLPKRFFCFLLMKLLDDPDFNDIIVTYTQTASAGYTQGHLAEDAMSPSYLPGFARAIGARDQTVTISIGFEVLGLARLLDDLRSKNQPNIILSFPCEPGSMRRQWNALREIASHKRLASAQDRLAVVSPWDAEELYVTLDRWKKRDGDLALAPFGPKPHSLGMTLFALKERCPMWYTQPRSYNPDYSTGRGTTIAYWVKHTGCVCYNRQVAVL
jgi:hypothetical protein